MKVVYIHHPDHHVTHSVYAKSVQADFLAHDFYFPYCLHKKHQRIRKYISWLMLWIRFPYKKYDIILTDEPQFYACIIKLFSFGRVKLASTQASISLNKYFNNGIPKIGAYIFKRACNYYDLIIAIGDIQYELAQKICQHNKNIKIERSFNGVSDKFVKMKERVVYNPLSKNVIAISNIPSEEILNVKGVDLMIRTFIEIKRKRPDLQFLVIGYIEPELLKNIESEYNLKENSIHFTGPKNNFEEYFNDAVCAFHFSRMEAWALAVNELLFVGVPVFISTEVGAKSIYESFHNPGQFIISNTDLKLTEEKINFFLSLSDEAKGDLSNECKSISQNFTEANAAENFKKIFLKI